MLFVFLMKLQGQKMAALNQAKMFVMLVFSAVCHLIANFLNTDL